MLDNVGLRYPHRASGAKAPRTLRPLPLLRFAVSATGGAHLCSIQYYLRFWLSICRTSLAVSALRIMRYCPYNFYYISYFLTACPPAWGKLTESSHRYNIFFSSIGYPIITRNGAATVAVEHDSSSHQNDTPSPPPEAAIRRGQLF